MIFGTVLLFPMFYDFPSEELYEPYQVTFWEFSTLKGTFFQSVSFFHLDFTKYFTEMLCCKGDSEDEGHWKFDLISSGSWKFINAKIRMARSTTVLVSLSSE